MTSHKKNFKIPDLMNGIIWMKNNSTLRNLIQPAKRKEPTHVHPCCAMQWPPHVMLQQRQTNFHSVPVHSRKIDLVDLHSDPSSNKETVRAPPCQVYVGWFIGVCPSMKHGGCITSNSGQLPQFTSSNSISKSDTQLLIKPS